MMSKDTIYRQDAIKTAHLPTIEDAGYEVIRLDDILTLPSAQPEPHWIPCSERLPEDEQEILFSTRTGRVHSGRYHDDGSANPWYSHRDKASAWNNVVNAWMPLPEPYPERREDE